MTKETPLGTLTEFTFETERLSVQHWQGTLENRAKRLRLCDVLGKLLSPQVLVDLPKSLLLDEDPTAISNWIDARARESECFLIEKNSNGTVLGLLILVEGAELQSIPTLHIGYLFAQDAWGRGYATELVAGILEAAKNGSPVCFIGGVAKTNPASARVLQKLGFGMQDGLSTDETIMYRKFVNQKVY